MYAYAENGTKNKGMAVAVIVIRLGRKEKKTHVK